MPGGVTKKRAAIRWPARFCCLGTSRDFPRLIKSCAYMIVDKWYQCQTRKRLQMNCFLLANTTLLAFENGHSDGTLSAAHMSGSKPDLQRDHDQVQCYPSSL